MKNRGFIKLYRSVLSKPEMTDLVAEQGATGFGTYLMIVLYLSQCDDGEGLFTNAQLSALAAMAHKSRAYVRCIITRYGLFRIDGKRFRVASGSNHDEDRNQNSPAYLSLRTQDKEVEIEKENKENAVVRESDDTHGSRIGPSAYETVDREGWRRGGHGEPVPWWAPPQTDVYARWSLVGDCWTAPSAVDGSAEKRRLQEMQPEDFMMKTAWERLDESEHFRIQDNARRI